jgi:hypothetical protein
VEPRARELITKNEILNENWMYTVSANAEGRLSSRYKGLLSRLLSFIDMQVLSIKILYQNSSIEKVKLQNLSKGLHSRIEELFLAT